MAQIPLEERIASVVQKISTTPAQLVQADAVKAEVANAAVSTPAGEKMVQKAAETAAAAIHAVDPTKPAEPKPAEPKKDYINLAKIEARLQAERRQFQAEMQQREQHLRQREEAASKNDKFWSELQSRAEVDPAGVAKEIGLDYGKWTGQILNNGESTADQKIQGLVKEIQNLRTEAQQERENAGRIAAERLNNEAMATVQNFRSDINQFVETNAEQYAGIKAMGLQSLVYDLIKGHYQTQGKLLGVKEASDILEESVIGAVDKFVQSKKWQDRVSSKSAKGMPNPSKDTKQEENREVRTVSNEMTAEAGTPTPSEKRLSFNERIQRAVASAEAKKAARV